MTDTPAAHDRNFSIHIDGQRGYVELRLKGHWEMTVASRFRATLRTMLAPALARGGCKIGEQVTLFDTAEFPVQSQDVLALLADMATDRSIGSRRIAMVLNSPLAQRQARRVAPDYAIFTDRDEALAWLAEAKGTDTLLRMTGD